MSATIDTLERARFFARQLVGPDDLTADQRYFREKHRRHNRLLHGWGIVCGVRVRAVDRCKVAVEAGYVLGPYGDEILVPEEVTVDVCKEDLDGFAVCGPADPWCSDVRPERPSDQPLFLAIRACERETRPVRVVSCGCGCDDSECEYSRIRDGYAIKVLTDLPDGYTTPMTPPGAAGLLGALSCTLGRRGACPACPTDPWVILADLVIDGDENVQVSCDPHRRYVVSFAEYWFACGAKEGLSPNLLHVMLGERPTGKEYALVAEDAPADRPPAASVAVRLADRWVSMPATFEVKRGDTYGSLLAREGARTYGDPATGDSYTLSELYAAAGVDPAAPVGSVTEALAPLEGRSLDVEGLRVVQSGLRELLDRRGAERLHAEHADLPAAAGSLPAVELTGVAAKSPLGGALADATIADVAGQDRDAFVEKVAEGVPDRQRAAVRRQAAEVHAAATRVARLAAGWHAGEQPTS
ncbi:MAG TPA: hypothetical protein VH834_09465 [Solirubrobacteraceae bacterium]|jgi:hypothetical protein